MPTDCFLHLFTVFYLKLSGGWQSTQETLYFASRDFHNAGFLFLTFILLSCRDIGTKSDSELYANMKLMKDNNRQ